MRLNGLPNEVLVDVNHLFDEFGFVVESRSCGVGSRGGVMRLSIVIFAAKTVISVGVHVLFAQHV